MKVLSELIREVDSLSQEDQAGLATRLLANMRGVPQGPDDLEIARRDAEIDAGTATLLSHEEFCKAVGR